MPATTMIKKIVKVTKAQMNSLINGGSVGGHTYDPAHCLYMVDDGLDLPEESGRYFLVTDDDGDSYSYELADDSAGSATQPIYFDNGEPVPTTYSLNKTVPADALFTDTKNTAGSTNVTTKLFLVGAGSQAANPTTYSNIKVYTQNGELFADGITLAASKLSDGKNNTYYLVIPNTTSWTANKTIATTDEIPQIQRFI